MKVNDIKAESVSRNETINLQKLMQSKATHKRELFIVQDASLKNEIEGYRRCKREQEEERNYLSNPKQRNDFNREA